MPLLQICNVLEESYDVIVFSIVRVRFVVNLATQGDRSVRGRAFRRGISMKKFGLRAVTTLALASASYLALASSSYAADMVLKGPAVEATQPVSGYIELYTGWG